MDNPFNPFDKERRGYTVRGYQMEEDEFIDRITERVLQAADPVRVILFGSRARGNAGTDSDYDLMVVERNVADRMTEMVRLSRRLRSLGIPIDLIVVSAGAFEYWKDTPGNVYYEAATEGRRLYEAA